MKKRLALGLAAVLAVSTLAGCGGGSTNTTTAADSAAETTAAGEQKPAEETAAQADNASTGGQVEIKIGRAHV